MRIYDQLNGFIALDPDDTPAEDRRYGALGGRGKRNLSNVSRVIGVDVRGRNAEDHVDHLVLKEANEEGQRLFAELTERTRRDVTGARRLTYRDLIIAAAGQGGAFVGNPTEVADHIQEWFEAKACDGFNVFPSYNPDMVTAFADLVVPILQDRGLYRRDYSGPTFRDHLGIPRPANTLSRPSSVAAE